MMTDKHGWVYDSKGLIVGFVKEVTDDGPTNRGSQWKRMTISVDVLASFVPELMTIDEGPPSNPLPMPEFINEPSGPLKLARAIKL